MLSVLVLSPWKPRGVPRCCPSLSLPWPGRALPGPQRSLPDGAGGGSIARRSRRSFPRSCFISPCCDRARSPSPSFKEHSRGAGAELGQRGGEWGAAVAL